MSEELQPYRADHTAEGFEAQMLGNLPVDEQAHLGEIALQFGREFCGYRTESPCSMELGVGVMADQTQFSYLCSQIEACAGKLACQYSADVSAQLTQGMARIIAREISEQN